MTDEAKKDEMIEHGQRGRKGTAYDPETMVLIQWRFLGIGSVPAPRSALKLIVNSVAHLALDAYPWQPHCADRSR